MSKFNRSHAAAIRRAVHAYCKDRTLLVEAGERKTATGEFTFDSTKYSDHDDYLDVYPIRNVIAELCDGFTFDLYIYERHEDGDTGDLLLNLDARWNGTAWCVYCPFSRDRFQWSTPNHKAANR